MSKAILRVILPKLIFPNLSKTMRIKIIFLALLLGFSVLLSSCASSSTTHQDSTENVEKANVSNKVSTNSLTSNNANNSAKPVSNTNDAACYNLHRKGMKLLKSQTFEIDFEPFKKSCFVTFYGEEFSNPPLGAQFFIYKNDKEIFNFPDQFNGGNVLCRVERVSFEDLIKDDLKDIIIIGKCGAKTDAYNENMVYINTGEDFTSNKDSNIELMDFTKLTEIKKYVEEHQSKFGK